MRIIGGKLKKKKLLAVPGATTRPTSDRLRETLFNILSVDVMDAVVLDLFAGTGALGIEALSRHAHSAVFIDSQPQAISVIHKNIEACRFNDVIEVYKWDITRNLNCLNDRDKLFNLVFMDPPYNLDMIPKALDHLATTRSLSNNTTIVAEYSVGESIGGLPECYTVTDQRQYGKTAVAFLRYKM